MFEQFFNKLMIVKLIGVTILYAIFIYIIQTNLSNVTELFSKQIQSLQPYLIGIVIVLYLILIITIVIKGYKDFIDKL